MNAALLQPVAWAAAFWTALLLAQREQRLRLAVGLALGALLAHFGWGLLHAPRLGAAPAAWLDPTRGYCALFVPWGVLLAAPRGAGPRRRYLDAGLGALPLAFAVARLGCLAAGCCGGVATQRPFALGGVHPTALYEAAACAGLHFALRARPRARAAVALAGLGGVRLAVEPLRAAPPLGEPLVDPAWLAALLVVCAAWLAARELERWRPDPHIG